MMVRGGHSGLRLLPFMEKTTFLAKVAGVWGHAANNVWMKKSAIREMAASGGTKELAKGFHGSRVLHLFLFVFPLLFLRGPLFLFSVGLERFETNDIHAARFFVVLHPFANLALDEKFFCPSTIILERNKWKTYEPENKGSNGRAADRPKK
jgi:hypothetical protein